MTNLPESFSQLTLAQAKTNDATAIGVLIQSQRSYIAGMAAQLISRQLQAKTGVSDLVQDTLTAAFQGFHQFKGETEAELRGWLKAIVTNLAASKAHAFLDTAKRNVNLERPIDGAPTDQIADAIAVEDLSPSSVVSRLEERVILLEKLKTLPDITREVITFRYRDDLSFEQIAERVGKSVDAVKKIWIRGIESLKPQSWFKRQTLETNNIPGA